MASIHVRGRTAGPLLTLGCWLLAAPALAATDGFQPDLADIGTLPQHVAESEVVQQALAAPRPARPFQFAVGVPADVTLADGRWQTLDSDTVSWRTRLHSFGARSLNLEFAELRLPEGASLWLYDTAGRVVQGPYTAASVAADGRFWTPLVPGQDMVLEMRVPATLADAARLRIAKINHGFAKLDEETTGKSGSCNIDVACPQGDDWRDEIRSVARITVGGQYTCSGELLNNLRQDLRPLFITADHCRIEDSSGGPASSVVFYWNYQTSSCGGNPDGSLDQNQVGASFLADDIAADFTLVQLLQAPSPQYNVYYAGWNVSGSVPQRGASVHHPGGDEKRISIFTVPASRARADIGGGEPRVVETWRVTWTDGTTEPGSSGGGLWDENRYLVGVLSGGNASCDAPREPDYFGRLEEGWEPDDSPTGQLKAHLDPEDTGCLKMPGRDPAGPPATINTAQCTTTPTGSSAGDSGSGLLLGAMPAGLLAFLAVALLGRRRR